jgi:hypothetical protein
MCSRDRPTPPQKTQFAIAITVATGLPGTAVHGESGCALQRELLEDPPPGADVTAERFRLPNA